MTRLGIAAATGVILFLALIAGVFHVGLAALE